MISAQVYVIGADQPPDNIDQQISSLREVAEDPALARKPVLVLVNKGNESSLDTVRAQIAAQLEGAKHMTVATTALSQREALLQTLNDFANKYYPGRDALLAQDGR